MENIKALSAKKTLCVNITKTQILPIFNKKSVFNHMNLFEQNHINFSKEGKNLGGTNNI